MDSTLKKIKKSRRHLAIRLPALLVMREAVTPDSVLALTVSSLHRPPSITSLAREGGGRTCQLLHYKH